MLFRWLREALAQFPKLAELISGELREALGHVLHGLAEPLSLMLGGGFDDTAWSVRVSLANLDDDAYLRVGASLRAVLDEYLAEWSPTKNA